MLGVGASFRTNMPRLRPHRCRRRVANHWPTLSFWTGPPRVANRVRAGGPSCLLDVSLPGLPGLFAVQARGGVYRMAVHALPPLSCRPGFDHCGRIRRRRAMSALSALELSALLPFGCRLIPPPHRSPGGLFWCRPVEPILPARSQIKGLFHGGSC